MKKINSLIVFAILAMALQSQPILDYPQNAPEAGTVAELQFVETAGLTYEPDGPGVSWDFSQLVNTRTAQVTAIDPSLAPAGNQFPDANLALNMNDTVYTYTLIDENGFYYLGTQLAAGMYPYVMVYSDSRQFLAYPFTYNDSFFDTYKGVSIVLVAEVRMSAASNVLSDAYGTLTLPTGTYTDVLRIRIEDEEIDSIFVKGVLTSVETTFRTQYLWYAPQSKTPLLSYETVEVAGMTDTVCFYTTTGAGMNEDMQSGLYGLNIYPNPAGDFLMVESGTSGPSKVLISLVNQLGQTMLSKECDQRRAGLFTERIDIGSFPAGIYFVRASNAAGEALTQKFMVR
jgi:hypothetical protein